MGTELEIGFLSLLPVVVALAVAFVLKDAVLSLLFGSIVGVVLAGYDPITGLAHLLRESLGNDDFIWVMLIELSVGTLIAFYIRVGAMQSFTDWALKRVRSPRSATGFAWILGGCVFFSDYFSPLFSGPITRPLTDRHKVSREMLAYILDSGSAPICTLIPISGWAVYIAALLQGYGPVETAEQGMAVFIQSIPYNIYGWLTVIMAGLVAFRLFPNFGPMRKAELRAQTTGKVLRDGATPLTGIEFDMIPPSDRGKPNLLLFFLIPNLMIVGISLGTFWFTGSTKILEAFLAAIAYMAIAMSLGKHFTSTKDGMSVALNGMKAVLPAVLILAAAYCINSISKSLGAPQFVLSAVEPWMTASLLPLVTFGTAALISFFTGTSWGTYAIMTPFMMPLALAMAGDVVSGSVLLTIGSLTGGALFGDHCSPISDTTSLASFGAGADHMDHVTTQLPYALLVATFAAAAYLTLGYCYIDAS
ncbi:Malate-2H(+)/Na(+)-lactate antiporter [Rosistilla ulvae]|uniref:Malate-2H(+)/Na(+)-lactate antiporter n=1 Tax=Rosistilla ulvae TaxID=1930277 RepID=A0A517LWD1_9BACT|nr:Na+/H+ antiporter NhaC family protein [Rosistilla ulvae]QDS86930.1 Malate-2H(+)/Na(+)-lactate antiporter [Rosistilla ulvae]